MKTKVKRIFSLIALSVFSFSCVSCALNRNSNNSSSETNPIDNPNNDGDKDPSKKDNEGDNPNNDIDEKGEDPMSQNKNLFINYSNIKYTKDLENYISQVKTNSTTWNNDAVKEGVIISPYYKAVMNETEFTPFATNVSYGIHSFLYIVLKENFLSFDLTFNEILTSCQIISNSINNPVLSFNQNVIHLELFEARNYTLIPNNNKEKCITIFVEKPQSFCLPQGYTKREIVPGRYEELITTKEKEVLYFKKGYFEISKIELSSNSNIYFEDGAYVKAINPADLGETPIVESDWHGDRRYVDFISAEYKTNILINGHGILDFSSLDFHARKPLYFFKSSSILVKDIMLNNSPEWNTYNAVSSEIHYENCKIFGYRMNSDGYCFIDSKDCSAKNCFARSGDDLFEVKSMYGAETQEIKNIVFDDCVAWPDKARGMGIISESKRPITNCVWKNSSICWYDPKWMDALGALVIISDSDTGVTHTNNTFENIHIYNNNFYPINVTNSSNSTNTISKTVFRNITIQKSFTIRVGNENSPTSCIDDLLFSNVLMDDMKVNSLDFIKTTGSVFDIRFE